MDSQRTGDVFSLTSVFLWSCFPIILKSSYASMGPLHIAAYSLAITTIVLAFFLWYRHERIILPTRSQFLLLILLTLITGVTFNTLLFIGFQYTSSANGSILLLLEVLTSYVVLSLCLKHESVHLRDACGAVLMLCGAVILLARGFTGFQYGDVIITLATFLPPFGNRITQTLRSSMHTEVILFWRSALSFPVFFLVAFFLEPQHSMWSPMLLGLLVFNGLFIHGLSKILWIESIHRITVVRAASFLAVQPFFVAFLSYVFLGERVTLLQILSVVPILWGFWLLMSRARNVARN